MFFFINLLYNIIIIIYNAEKASLYIGERLLKKNKTRNLLMEDNN